jgi:hypothetical protein
MRRQRRARKAVLWGLAGFVVMQAGLGAVLAWGPWPFLRDPAYGYKAALLERRLAGPERPYTLVLLGSSRSMWSVDTAALEPLLASALQRPVVAFNFAQVAHGPVSQELYLRRLLRQRLRPDLLLVEIHPLFLAGQAPQEGLEEGRLPASWLRRDELALVRGSAGPRRPGLRRAWAECWALPAYGHRLALLNYFAPQLLPRGVGYETFGQIDAAGFLPFHRVPYTPTAEQHRIGVAGARQQYEKYCDGFRLGDVECRALRHIAALSRQEGIAVVWLLSPEGPAFRSWYPPGAREEVRRFVVSLAAAHSSLIIDATDWVPEEDFWDSHHLIAPAGPRYTERLGREGLLPLLEGPLAAHTRRPPRVAEAPSPARDTSLPSRSTAGTW